MSDGSALMHGCRPKGENFSISLCLTGANTQKWANWSRIFGLAAFLRVRFSI